MINKQPLLIEYDINCWYGILFDIVSDHTQEIFKSIVAHVFTHRLQSQMGLRAWVSQELKHAYSDTKSALIIIHNKSPMLLSQHRESSSTRV